jgi:hypothetical protein
MPHQCGGGTLHFNGMVGSGQIFLAVILGDRPCAGQAHRSRFARLSGYNERMESDADKDGFRIIPHDDFESADDVLERSADLWSINDNDIKSLKVSLMVLGVAAFLLVVFWLLMKLLFS